MAEQQAGQLGKFERYLVEEFYDDYREGSISRRTFIRRVAFITGSMAAASTAMLAVGCQPIEVPAATDPMPEAEGSPTASPEAEAEAGAVPGAQSPLSVPEGDPELETSDVTFTSQGDEITAYLARPVAEGTYPAVMVCHENRGLTAHIRDVARRFAKAGYVAIAPDLMAREGGTDTLDRDEVPGLLTNAGTERHVADFTAAMEYLQGQEFVEAERIGMVSLCVEDDELGPLLDYSASNAEALKAAEIDLQPLRERRLALERIDQIAFEHLAGVR